MTRRLRRRLLPAFAALACALVCFAEARGAWRAAGDVVSVTRRPDGVLLRLSSGARASVTFAAPDVVRVRLAPGGTFERDFSYAVEPKARGQVTPVMTPGDTRCPARAGATVSRVYEEAGEGYEHLRGRFGTPPVAVAGDTIRLSRAGADHVSRPLAALELVGLAARPRELRADGRPVDGVTYDARTRRVVVPLPPEHVEAITVVR